jgi:mannose-6-phosphate isomerase
MRKLSSKEIENEKKKWEEYYSMNLGEELEEIAGKPIKIEKIRKRKAWGYEEWLCSTHPSIQSRVGVRGRKIPLIHLLNHFPSILDEEWRGELPILLKIIHAEENLSLQLHPSDESAALLQEDDRGKNEAWVVLDAKRKSKIHFLKRYEEEISEEKLFSTSVRKGDVFWIPAGLPHSIGKGITIFEIQQPSALTYRIWDWGRKRKLDLEKASKAVKIFEPEKLRMERRYGKRENLIKNPYFRITEINLERGEGVDLEGFCILTVIQGKAKIGSHILSGGESVILPSNLSCRMEAFQRTVVMESSGVI